VAAISGTDRQCLSALTDKLGFAIVESGASRVRFERPGVFVNVYHGRSSYEVGVEIGRPSQASEVDRPFDLAELIAAADPAAARRYRRPQASDRTSLRNVLNEAAAQLFEYGTAALRGAPEAFDALGRVRVEQTKDFGRTMRQEDARARLQECWNRKDYERVIAALDMLRGDMTQAEAKKYEYARKQLHRN